MNTVPFTMNRRIAWGECDPARIYYTPRIVDYALETIEVWLEEILGLSWVEIYEGRGLHISSRSIGCTYMRPMVAGQTASLQLWPIRIEKDDLVLRVLGSDEKGESCFQVDAVIGLTDRKNGAPVPLSPECLAAIQGGRAFSSRSPIKGSGEDEQGASRVIRPEGGQNPSGVPPRQAGSPSEIFTRRRRVAIGDCSAGGFLDASKVFEYAVETVGEWYEAVVGVGWMELVSQREYGAPFVSAAADYLRHPRPGDVLALDVQVTHLGEASLGFVVGGFDLSGETCFRTKLKACFIDRKKFKSMRIPDEFRSRIESYMQSCSDRTSEEAC